LDFAQYNQMSNIKSALPHRSITARTDSHLLYLHSGP